MNSEKEKNASESSKVSEETFLSILGLLWTKRYHKLIEFVQKSKGN